MGDDRLLFAINSNRVTLLVMIIPVCAFAVTRQLGPFVFVPVTIGAGYAAYSIERRFQPTKFLKTAIGVALFAVFVALAIGGFEEFRNGESNWGPVLLVCWFVCTIWYHYSQIESSG